MAGIYVYSDKPSLAGELIGFAKKTGKGVTALAFSAEATQAINNKGADRICLLTGESPLPESYAKAIAQMLEKEKVELFLVGATARGRGLAAGVAGYLDCGMVSDAVSLKLSETAVETERMLYGGAVIQSETLEGLSVVTVSSGKFDPIQGETEIVCVPLEADTRVKLMESALSCQEGVDLSAAEKVVCVGMGLNKQEDLQMVKDLAKVLGAEIGCSRGVAEERRWLPESSYIGISGTIVKPILYLSLGVSGQIQHVFGMRDSKIVVAIDTNEKAPIFRAADYGIVGDLYEVVPLLTNSLKE